MGSAPGWGGAAQRRSRQDVLAVLPTLADSLLKQDRRGPAAASGRYSGAICITSLAVCAPTGGGASVRRLGCSDFEVQISTAQQQNQIASSVTGHAVKWAQSGKRTVRNRLAGAGIASPDRARHGVE